MTIPMTSQPSDPTTGRTTRFVVTDHAFVETAHEAAAAQGVGAAFAVHQCAEAAETTEVVRDADVVFVNFAPIGAEQLAAMAPGATVIRYGVGYDNVDVEAAHRLGVQVANVPDYGVDTVADHAAALLLSLLRRIPLYDRGIRGSTWVAPGDAGPVPSFATTTVGLLGAGRIACSLADRLRPFGFRLLAHDPYADADVVATHGLTLVDRDTLLAESHAISLHLPVTPETRHLVDADLLARVRRGCVVVNTARGALVDEAALAEALVDGRVGGAGLDVFDPEPLAADSPLRSAPNALFTPHAAFYSETSLDNLQRLAAEEAVRAARGEPLRCPVTPVGRPDAGAQTSETGDPK
ncbi:D-3-phosphoglycerate dehydrogenase [Microlunatus sagamiharensis]|uniref:D-3-phosphoglycerate dehydrogenase n=1 Tax=Microlunatus sagamiharensis TaxID=546874 RepID=A0A1H2MLF2_9ACTN|nr:C-terminal binding protein [Microlunatus sagamiharensis]SDU93808.1 D-3-phosphoglycerate dehydrogenase [Microlunatus sagamiharensis]